MALLRYQKNSDLFRKCTQSFKKKLNSDNTPCSRLHGYSGN